VLSPDRVLVVYHRDGLEVVSIVPGTPLVVGRTEPSDLQYRSRRLSRTHARFEQLGDDVYVEDLASTNGTYVDGARVEQRVVVPRGARVNLGSVTITVHASSERWLRVIGLPGHPRFDLVFETEVVRAQTFSRPLGLVMLRVRGAAEPNLPFWVPRVAERLRPVDRLTAFGPDSVQILLPEMGAEDAAAFARATAGALEEHVPLTYGVAVYPDDGPTPSILVEAVRSEVLRAGPSDPIDVRGEPASEDPAIVIRDPAVAALYRTVERVGPSMISVLIVGETGTGKEVLARRIHERSSRRDAPMHVVNCGAIPPALLESTLFGHERGAFTGADRRRVGVFEEAAGGTVFLDEVGELPLLAQVALLRVLETRRIQRIGSSQEVEVDVRVIAATHRNLEAMCDAREFRWDLLYRLNGITLSIPPLRDRPSEIRSMVARFVRDSNRINSRDVRAIAPDAMALLERYPWPGNVRELRNTIDRAVVVALSDVLTVDDLPERVTRAVDLSRMPTDIGGPADDVAVPLGGLSGPGDLKDLVRAFEVALIRAALRAADGNQTQASGLLGIPRRTLVYKIRSFEIAEWERVEPLRPEVDDVGRPIEFSARVARYEREIIDAALERAGGDLRSAARLLNIQQKTLEQKVDRR
jgi:DNA-binding NtrC family response regulator